MQLKTDRKEGKQIRHSRCNQRQTAGEDSRFVIRDATRDKKQDGIAKLSSETQSETNRKIKIANLSSRKQPETNRRRKIVNLSSGTQSETDRKARKQICHPRHN